MKIGVLLITLTWFTIAHGQSVVEIPAGSRVTIGYPDSEDERFVSFTLRNETLKSIPLIIPGVMNPNLSPQSNSGVRLKIGQEIKYKKGGRAHLLLIVDNSIKEGDVLFVGERIAQVND